MGTAAVPRFNRLEPDARRKQILDCAIALFGERPYSDVSTVELASKAGVARALINHYFGTKRALYLEVIRTMLILPPEERMVLPDGDIDRRVDWFLDWFLDTVGKHGKMWLVAVGAEGGGSDSDVRDILAEADDLAAERLLTVLRVPADAQSGRALALVRAYGGTIKAAVREWLDRQTLTRSEVHLLLRTQLLSLNDSLLSESS